MTYQREKIVIGGEKFEVNVYDGVGGEKRSFVVGCFGHRYYNACARQELLDRPHVDKQIARENKELTEWWDTVGKVQHKEALK